MASDKKTKGKGKQYTTREIIMLVTLAMVALLYFYSNYFLFPTMNKITQLKADTDLLRTEYSERKALIAKEENMQNDLVLYNQKITSIKSNYFKTSNQEHFIKVLELELIDDRELEVSSLSFDAPKPAIEFVSEEDKSILLESSITSFPFSGPYESIMNLLYRLESYPNLIRVNFLDMTYLDLTKSDENLKDPIYQGNIGIEFFTIPQEYESPWNTQLPDYDNAIAFNGGLFNYNDGKLGIPPFLEEKVTEVIVGEGDNSTPVVEETPSNTGNEVPSPVVTDEDKDPIENPDEVKTSTYNVKPGDTIFSISMRFYGSADQVEGIMALNKITDPITLRSGSIIQLPLLMK